MTKSLNYLTVQDILWINLQVSGKVNHFNHAKLEEATFYQYAYGGSHNVLAQATRFAPGFLKMKPFDNGNQATTFVALIAFLKLNHYELSVKDSEIESWFEKLSSDKELLTKSVQKSEDHGHELDTKSTIESVVKRFPTVIKKLR